MVVFASADSLIRVYRERQMLGLVLLSDYDFTYETTEVDYYTGSTYRSITIDIEAACVAAGYNGYFYLDGVSYKLYEHWKYRKLAHDVGYTATPWGTFSRKETIIRSRSKEEKMKRVIGIVLICVLLIGVFFAGQRIGSMDSSAPETEATIPEEPSERNLRISVTDDLDGGYTTIPLEQGNYKDITYLRVTNVTIDISGTIMKLEDALQEGYISVDELIAYARQDASLGFCREAAKTKNGLTEFTYYYGDFDLRYVYDVYETPNGRKHLITDILIHDVRSEPIFRPVDEDTGEFIDYEDWGLEFEVIKQDPSGITILCSQSGGQQIGTLNVGTPMLYRKNPNALASERVEPLTEEGEVVFNESEQWVPNPNGFLTMGGETELSFDFVGLFGTLPAGDYELVLQIVDLYDEEDVPPLSRNFYDEQWYSIEFSIE